MSSFRLFNLSLHMISAEPKFQREERKRDTVGRDKRTKQDENKRSPPNLKQLNRTLAGPAERAGADHHLTYLHLPNQFRVRLGHLTNPRFSSHSSPFPSAPALFYPSTPPFLFSILFHFWNSGIRKCLMRLSVLYFPPAPIITPTTR